MKKYVRLLNLFLLALMLTPTANAQTDHRAQTLKGIQGMQVVVEDFAPPVVEAGMTSEKLQTDVELKLRLAGIKVLTESEMLNTPGYPTLYVVVTVLLTDTGLWVNSVEIEFQQAVNLRRNGASFVSATTWRDRSVGMVGRSLAVESIRNAVKDHVDKFINAYLSVNPRK